jgi:hypothetical protein
LGAVQVNTKQILSGLLTNRGQHPFEYRWILPKESPFIISKEKGALGKGESTELQITFAPKVHSIKQQEFKLVCKVESGTNYVLIIVAQPFR